MKILFSFLTVLCKSEKSDQLKTQSGAPDRVSIVCLVHDICDFSHKSDELTIQAKSSNFKINLSQNSSYWS